MGGIHRWFPSQTACIAESVSMHWHHHGPPSRYVKLRVAHASGMPGTFSPPPRVSDPDMHHGTCVTHVPWCMPGWLTSGFLWRRWWGKRSRHSRRTFTYLVRGPLWIKPTYLSLDQLLRIQWVESCSPQWGHTLPLRFLGHWRTWRLRLFP